MEEIRLGFGPREQRDIRLRALGLTGLFGAVALFVVSRSDGPGWPALVLLAAALALGVLTLLRYGSGTTLLTPSGVVLATWFGRRTVSWERITRIEVRRRVGRYGSAWMIARIHLADARPMPLPGLVEAKSGLPKAEFQSQVRTLLGYWQQATGRTEMVLFTP
ncbi:PH domain-containing protein [Streptomyces sp. NPDC046976]|uniref:PH domain-containing protein n=1 Tax=Streptomyces sp. NPDC046976 TaxID=3155258 RepID=UPI0033EC6420